MSGYDLYVFFLCLVVFILLTGLFSVMLTYIVKMSLKAIKHGLEDERIKTEYEKEIGATPVVKWVCRILSSFVFIVVLAVFVISLYLQLVSDRVTGSIAVPKVVLSSSMSYKNDANEYLEENQLDDQFNTFDIIFTHELPGEYELELYDIVAYDYHGDLVIHRIVGIEEPNEKHPDCRHFLLQGDAVKWQDEFPVLYEQMKSIYRGKRVQYAGSFFAFMQSPAGYLCILLTVFAIVATPIVEKKLWEAKVERLTEIGVIPKEEDADATEVD